MSYLKIENVSKYYGDDLVLENVSMSIKKGSFVSILGPSGCGKTTLLKIISGIEKVYKGKIYLKNNEITNMPIYKRNVALVFQNYALFPHLSVKENILYGLKNKKNTKEEKENLLEEIISIVKLKDFVNRKVNELSGGQRQRVALGRALIIKPDLLLLDESLNALDRELRIKMQSELKEIQKKTNITTIFITHDQEEALKLSDEIMVMRDGAIVQRGTPKDIYEQPKDLFVAKFIGEINVLGGMVKSVKEDFCEIDMGGQRLFINPHKNLKVGQAHTFAVRPEKINIWNKEKVYNEGVIEDITYKGNMEMCSVILQNATKVKLMMQNMDDSDKIKKGDKIKFAITDSMFFGKEK
ncbi:MAG: ABC transporter ATP-binding protein [Anaeromicrobium sp.]|jgi:ABC-type Fe3+/spermidine/putrescine transport system ATPase subunit|uniref:ABC transporter ATP-binding protein n=1 Tax=Anaeromicrobium sp. TaxID=1929132 RepID=UPI0025E28B9F|nr:ABC transporter ATP-binding protein [Anaeromicrobium sp.]MCT4596109.1 ABC transporter ATP-binding protein [Anaeromicrobium sp.]